MNTFFSVIHLIISFFGILFLAYLLYRFWVKNRWRISPKTYKNRLEFRKAQQRMVAKKEGKKKFPFNGGKAGSVIIWEKSWRRAQRRYVAMKAPKKSLKTKVLNFLKTKNILTTPEIF